MTTPTQLTAAQRRRILRDLLDPIIGTFEDPNETPPDLKLSTKERLVLFEVLTGVLDGRDIQKDLGIKPKRGAPVRDSGRASRELCIARHYWILRSMPPEEKDAVARTIVAEIWECSTSRVYKIALKNKTGSLGEISTQTRSEHLRQLERMAHILKKVDT
jgi:hypothetical protein